MNDNKDIITDEVITEDMVDKAEIESLDLPELSDQINSKPLNSEILDFNNDIKDEPVVNNNITSNPFANLSNLSDLNRPLEPNNNIQVNSTTNLINTNEVDIKKEELIKTDTLDIKPVSENMPLEPNNGIVSKTDTNLVDLTSNEIKTDTLDIKPVSENMPLEPNNGIVSETNTNLVNDINTTQAKENNDIKKEKNNSIDDKNDKKNKKTLIIFFVILIIFSVICIFFFPLVKNIFNIGAEDKDTILSNAVYDYIDKTKGITAGDNEEVYCFKVQDLIDGNYIKKDDLYNTYLDKSIEVASKDNNISYNLTEECY